MVTCTLGIPASPASCKPSPSKSYHTKLPIDPNSGCASGAKPKSASKKSAPPSNTTVYSLVVEMLVPLGPFPTVIT